MNDDSLEICGNNESLSMSDLDALVDEHIYNGEYKTAVFWAEKRLALFSNRTINQRLPEIAKYLNVSVLKNFQLVNLYLGVDYIWKLANDSFLLQLSRIASETYRLSLLLREFDVQHWKLLRTSFFADEHICELISYCSIFSISG
jgi:hypothetical protein